MTLQPQAYPIENIRCPALLLHALNDPMAKVEDMLSASNRMPDSEKILYDEGAHFLFGHNEEYQQHIRRFISKVAEYAIFSLFYTRIMLIIRDPFLPLSLKMINLYRG